MKTVEEIFEKYPDRVPIIVNKNPKSNIADLEKHKYLVPRDLTMSQFIYIIRKNIKLTPDKALFVFCNNVLVPNSALLGQIYNEHADSDKYLYITYSGENVFG